jgi:peptidoglycan/LPS O-acetylase OafA/YrhL
MNSKPQYVSVQALRAAAALLVVGAHLGDPKGFEAKIFGSNNLLGWLTEIGPTGVDLFFVVSGFIMTVTTQRLASGVQPAGAFLLRRITRIYPCYVLLTGAIFAVYLWRPELVNSSAAVRPDPLASFLLLPQEGLPLLLVGWTLVYEMFFYLIFAGSLLLKRSRLPLLVGAWVAVLVALQPVSAATSNAYIGLALSPLNIEFVLGIGLAMLVLAGRIWAPRAAVIAGVMLLVAGTVVSGSTVVDGITGGWLRVALVGIPMTLVLYGAVGGELRHRWVPPRFLVQVGDASYSLYLVHVPVLSVVGIGLGMVALDPALPVRVPVLTFAALTAVGGGFAFYVLVEKPLIGLVHDWAPKPRRATGHQP